jgi:hypothetical protein
MAKRKKLSPDLHIPLADIPYLSASDLLAIDGPKFITSDSMEGAKTFAVLISHDKWRTMNHTIPAVSPHRAGVFWVGEQAYLTIPVEQRGGTAVWHPVSETGLEIITRKRSKPK